MNVYLSIVSWMDEMHENDTESLFAIKTIGTRRKRVSGICLDLFFCFSFSSRPNYYCSGLGRVRRKRPRIFLFCRRLLCATGSKSVPYSMVFREIKQTDTYA